MSNSAHEHHASMHVPEYVRLGTCTCTLHLHMHPTPAPAPYTCTCTPHLHLHPTPAPAPYTCTCTLHLHMHPTPEAGKRGTLHAGPLAVRTALKLAGVHSLLLRAWLSKQLVTLFDSNPHDG